MAGQMRMWRWSWSVQARGRIRWSMVGERKVVVRDPLGLYREPRAVARVAQRKPNPLRRRVAYQIFNPDPTVVWARSLEHDSELLHRLRGFTHVVASSPPESVHVGAASLARRLRASFVMDLRDGWLDEPLRPLLQVSRLRRWREARLERRCVAQAQAVVVTSESWRRLLTQRYSSAASKVHVVTNAYPALALYNVRPSSGDEDARLRLVHARSLLRIGPAQESDGTPRPTTRCSAAQGGCRRGAVTGRSP
jgi:hypothetical protein